MRILVDLQAAQNKSRTRGIGRFARAFARALITHGEGHDIFLLVSGLFPDQIDPVIRAFDGLLPPDRILRFEAPGPAAEVDGFVEPGNIWRVGVAELLFEKFVADLEMDAVIFTTLFEGAQDDTVLSLLNLSRAHVTAIVLHDLIPLSDPEQYIGWEPSRNWYFRKLETLRRADVLLAISESAKSEAVDLAGFAPDRIAVVSQAADEDLHAPDGSAQDLLDRHGITRPFVMHMSAYEPRKNFQGLIAAFAALPADIRAAHQLVLVCKLGDESRLALLRAADKAGLSDDEMVLTDFVTDEDLARLYASAKLFAFPSFHEGFGLPALEAMQCGAPVIGSSLSSMPEVIGRADALFDPHSIPDITRLLTRALSDDAFLADLRAHSVTQAKRFSWERTAKATLAAIEAARATRRPSARLSSEALIPLIAQVEPATPPTAEDLARTAMALAANEATARTVRHRAETPINWRLEGPFDSSYSLALVNREIARALAALGHAPQLHSAEGGGDFDPDPAFLEANPDLAALHRASREGHAPDIISRNLFPPRVADMTGPLNALHGYAWEEAGFPRDWAADFNRHLDLILVVSRHVEKVLIDNGVHVPVAVIGNGVDHWDRIDANPAWRVTARGFRFLHVSSCFPRKGVEDLLDAYGDAFTAADDVSLIIKTFANPHNAIARQIADRQAERPDYPHVVLLTEDLADADLKSLYGQCDVMVAPSRAEGYGLPFAEAMLSGLPVIATGWSGQRDFCDAGDSWLVDYRFERPQTHFGLSASAWARVDREALADALRTAHATPPMDRAQMAANGRAQLLAEHKWQDVAGRMLDALADLPARTAARSAPRIGWVSTWNARCGIATYSQHLVAHMPGPVTILAAHADATTGEDDANCIRCWTSSKTKNDLEAVADRIEALGLSVLVLQFNYAFYNHEELCALIDRAKAAGCAIVMMLHSTRDPVKEIPGAELFRIADHLRRCDRLLVHSIADLNRLKDIGLTDNVALFPHGALTHDAPPPPPTDTPLLASYGFCLPDKGLGELVDAVALLRDAGRPVRLRMVNAEFPAPGSTALVADLRAQIAALNLDTLVAFHSDFLPDEQSLALLSDASLILFPYQKSGESASGAVRYGMATGRPVAVTPLAVFDDVADASFPLPGTSAREIADGIAATLDALAADDAQAQSIASHAAAWRAAHDYAGIGQRLHNLCRALHNRRAPRPLVLPGSSTLLGAPTGVAVGPLLPLTQPQHSRPLPFAPGRHILHLNLAAPAQGMLTVTLTDSEGTPLAQADLSAAASLDLPFTLARPGGVILTLTPGAGCHADLAAVAITPAP